MLDLYQNLVNQQINLEARANKLDQEEILRQRSRLLADFVIRRRQIFDGNEKAQVHLYGKKLLRGRDSVDKKQVEEIIYEFLSGRYLSEKDVVTSSPDVSVRSTEKQQERNLASPSRTIRDPNWEPPLEEESIDFQGSQVSDALSHCDLPSQGEAERIYSDTSPEFVSYHANVYIAEHIAFLPNWLILEGLFEDTSLKHTSIAADIYKISIAKRTVKLYDEDGRLINSKSWDVEFWDRVSWELVNGCMGDYESDDVVRVVHTSTHETVQDARRFLHQYQTPHIIQGGAYCVGCKFKDFTCHQLSNAFAYGRWNFIPIEDLTVSSFGYFGKLGISPHEDSCGNQHTGCIPGRPDCYYNSVTAHVTCPPGCGTTISVGEGIGWGLDKLWDVEQGKWIPSKITYKQKNIPEGFGRQDQFERHYCRSIGSESGTATSTDPSTYMEEVVIYEMDEECYTHCMEDCINRKEYKDQPESRIPPNTRECSIECFDKCMIKRTITRPAR